jgi:hypothetical protein
MLLAPRSRRPSPRWIHRLLARPPSGRFDRARITPIVTVTVRTSFRATKSRCLLTVTCPGLLRGTQKPCQARRFTSFNTIIVMHRMQRLALFAACNIDGRKPKKFDRDTGAVSASQRKRSSLSLNSSRIGAPSTRCRLDNLSRTVALFDFAWVGMDSYGAVHRGKTID